jgi:hypothetical protein
VSKGGCEDIQKVTNPSDNPQAAIALAGRPGRQASQQVSRASLI